MVVDEYDISFNKNTDNGLELYIDPHWSDNYCYINFTSIDEVKEFILEMWKEAKEVFNVSE